MRFKEFKIDYSVPFGSITELYENLGIMEELRKEAIRRGFDAKKILFPPEFIKCNGDTQEKIINAWKTNWRNYNYNRRTGLPKTKVLKKYSRPHSLSYDEKRTIEVTFYLGDGPAQEMSLPDDVLRVYLDWPDDKIKIKEEYCY